MMSRLSQLFTDVSVVEVTACPLPYLPVSPVNFSNIADFTTPTFPNKTIYGGVAIVLLKYAPCQR